MPAVPVGATMDDELPELVLPIEERDHVIGPLSARYTLVEYGEYRFSAVSRSGGHRP